MYLLDAIRRQTPNEFGIPAFCFRTRKIPCYLGCSGYLVQIYLGAMPYNTHLVQLAH